MNQVQNWPLGSDPYSDETGRRETLERQRLLGARLRTLFSGVAVEPIPDDLADLLDQLPERGRDGRR
jgi:hypothetical protein